MFTQKKILIVDDEQQSRLYLAEILKEMHPEYCILLASTPDEALFITKKECIDLILLDVEMPGMSGLEMLSKLRTELPNLPVIFVSAYKRAEFIQKAIRLDALDYLDKPVDPFELECSLNKVFQRKSISIESTKEIERFRLLTNAGDMFVEVHEVIYFNSDGRYSIAYLADGKPVQVRENLEALSKKLPAKYFLRVSRQHIANIHCIKLVSKANKTITLNSCQTNTILHRIYPQIITKLVEDFRL
jgi:DNA-binding LytR/AlgR family response regulator